MRRRMLPTAAAPAPRSDDRCHLDRWRVAALARAHEAILAPHAFTDDVAWRARVAEALGALFGVDHALVLLPGARRPYVGVGFDAAALDAMAAFHPAPAPGAPALGAPVPRVAYRDPALARLQARVLARRPAAAGPGVDPGVDPVFTRRGNEAAMGRPVEGTAMFDAVCRPAGVADFHGVFARASHGDVMLFVAHGGRRGRGAGRGTWVGEAAVPLLRVLAPAVAAIPGLVARAWPAASGGGATLPDARALHARFGLTPREADVARGLARGWTRRQIAAAYGVSEATARHHTEAVFRKLDVTRRGAVALALLAGP